MCVCKTNLVRERYDVKPSFLLADYITDLFGRCVLTTLFGKFVGPAAVADWLSQAWRASLR